VLTGQWRGHGKGRREGTGGEVKDRVGEGEREGESGRGRGGEVGWGEEEQRGEERKRDGEGLPPLEWRSGYAPGYTLFTLSIGLTPPLAIALKVSYVARTSDKVEEMRERRD